jgi:hypothetical protein
MPLRVIRLSGFKSSDVRGKIVVDTLIMTPQAIDRTKSGCLCWSDVRFLDDAFGKSLASDVNGMEYRRGLRMSAGRHLFSILTGKKIYPGPGQNPYRIQNNVNSPSIMVDGGMTFPNAYGLDATHSDYYSLASLQVDSDYGHFCHAQWKESLKSNGPKSGHKFALRDEQNFFNLYARLLTNNQTLCQQDKNDIFAYCVLQYWSIFCSSTVTKQAAGFGAGLVGGASATTTFAATSMSGTVVNFPVPVPALPANFSSSYSHVALDWVLTAAGLSGFAAAFGISPGYGSKAFPRIP